MDIPTIDQAIALRPGDTVLVRVDPTTAPETATALQEALAERLGDVHVQVVAAEDITRPTRQPRRTTSAADLPTEDEAISHAARLLAAAEMETDRGRSLCCLIDILPVERVTRERPQPCGLRMV
ncbi:hypothetical protein [Nocardiopsis aegyptia]|uniref:Uncharacterized protein n=1 Tax=Nocardiopsis aegyptia TaxID=220378 RepID=A0A7Z0EK23_9ACTN|nr:hypothetical protein [Nocardiopsis aegyptia]NYJ33446.1 hypothetical protein [Nocardiopsis aegyptia]